MKECSIWRKARIGARIILRSREKSGVTRRDARLAEAIAADPAVTDRLLDQGIAAVLGRRAERAATREDACSS
jgi:hypothetical protein